VWCRTTGRCSETIASCNWKSPRACRCALGSVDSSVKRWKGICGSLSVIGTTEVLGAHPSAAQPTPTPKTRWYQEPFLLVRNRGHFYWRPTRFSLIPLSHSADNN
jgi:hypothetical protein